jgi:dihydroflavonol-4-reductase
MKALVTGAAGFIGSSVVRALLDAGHEVRALHLPKDDLRNLDGLDIERVEGDICDRDRMIEAARGCRWVFHLAAIYSLAPHHSTLMWRVNVEGARNVLEAAKRAGAERTVVTSSIARFGGQGRGERATESSPFGLGDTGEVYAQTKAIAHEVAIEAARAGQDVVVVCPTGPIGPGDVRPTPTGRLLLFASKLPISVVVDSASNFADVRDMARGHVLAAERGKSGEAYLLGHEDLSFADIARMAQRISGRSERVVVVPKTAARIGARAALYWAARAKRTPLLTPAAVRVADKELRADCSKAKRELGLECGSIERALHDALEWFRRERYL